MKNKLIGKIIICLIVMVGIVVGVKLYKHFFSNKPYVVDNNYKTTTVKKMNMQVNVDGKGSVYADISQDIIANNNGVLKDLNVKIGDTVNKGDNLFTVDNNDLRQNVLSAQNNLERQKLTLDKSKNESEATINNLAVKDAENKLNNANEQLSKATASSPISGIITAKNNNSGNTVPAGKTILTVIDPSSMKIKVSVDELNISKVKVGQNTQITFNALAGKKYEGIVDAVSQAGTVVNNTTTYEVIVSIKNPTDIKIGMNANVKILIENKNDVLAVSKKALIENEGKHYVLTSVSDKNENNLDKNSLTDNKQLLGKSGQDNKGNVGEEPIDASKNESSEDKSNSKLVLVTIGISSGDYVQILDGVQEGEEVLIRLPKVSDTGVNSEDMINKIKRFSGK